MTTEPRTKRRTAVAALAAGAASMALLAPRPALAAMSSAAGIVAGGSVAGSGGASQFSAFGSKLTLDDSEEPVLFCALSWFDPAGADGGPLAIEFDSVASYGPTDVDGERLMTGTVTVNGEASAIHALAVRWRSPGRQGHGPRPSGWRSVVRPWLTAPRLRSGKRPISATMSMQRSIPGTSRSSRWRCSSHHRPRG